MNLLHIDWSCWPEQQTLEWAFYDPKAFAAAFLASSIDHNQRHIFIDGRWLDFVEMCGKSENAGHLLAQAERCGGEFWAAIADAFWHLQDRQSGRVAPAPSPNPNSDAFLQSFEWRRVRMMVLERDGGRCACCGRTAVDGVAIHVDHIKSRKRYPELALNPSNLQVLCEDCNHGKGNLFSTNWRRMHEARS